MHEEKKKLPEEKDLHIDRPKFMTTDSGRPVGDNQNSLTVGPRGPVVC
jgi:catalase